MATEGASSSSSQIPPWKYHVFLSFRGEDTRKGFTDHLYAAFWQKGIIAFRDNEQLQRGQVISHELLQAIQQSLSAVVVLSPNYASSTWCLDELQNILESKAMLDREVFPIFYGVAPSHVRNQVGSCAESFNKHEEKFSGDKKKVQRWKDALKEVANLAGWDSKHWPEAELIVDIVEKVWIKLQPKLPSYEDGLVGIDLRVKEMDSLLSIGSEDIRFIGLWGMGGIGKTTLARVIYDRFYSQFENFCFLPNVREVSIRPDGLVQLQKKLLSCLKISNLEIDDLYDGKKMIKNHLCHKKFLLVLDDICCINQLENLAANKQWFGAGSRIIVTTRDKHLLVSHVVCEKYEMKILNANNSFQLFSQKAFRSDKPPKHYLNVSKSIVQYAGGLPLALKVLGSFLCGRSLCEWEEALAKIRQFPPNEILNTLRISYDGLEDAEKAMFLDIAFFFTGQNEVEVKKTLKDCSLHSTIGMSLLIEKSLITSVEGILEMHALLQEMGRNVVFQESLNDASRCSRLSSLEDVNQVMTKNKGTEFIHGIILKLSEPSKAYWDPEAFSKMCNLRVLIIMCDLHLPLGLKCLSTSLKILEWKGYPLQRLPLGLPLDELAHLKMHCSKLKRLWNGTQYFRKLKLIDLSYSKDLIQIPNIFGVPCLERLVLKGCTNLVEVHQSVAQHKNLVVLDLEGCINLKTLPIKLEMNALEQLILSGCSKVKKLPEFGVSMGCLSMLNLRDCKSLVCLPQSIHNLKSLRDLDIGGCSKLFGQPNNLNENNALDELDLSGTTMRQVPSSVIDCKALKTLLFKGGVRLITNSWNLSLPTEKVFCIVKYPLGMDLKLPPLSSFSMLKKLDMSNCGLSDESILDDIGGLLSLEELYLDGNNFVNLPASIANLSRLIRLDLHSCQRLQTLPVLPPSLCVLCVQNCTQMAPIFFDPQKIQKTFEANRWKMKDSFWFVIPGSEIPAWFHIRDYFPLDRHLTDSEYNEKYAFIASIMVDIPDYCRSSDWIGIAVCLSLESAIKEHRHKRYPIMVRWAFKAPDTEIVYPLCFSMCYVSSVFSGHHLFITIFGSDHETFKPHLMGDRNKVELIFYGENHCKCGKLKLKNCGYCVMCKEGQVWRQGEAAREAEMASTSIVIDTHPLQSCTVERAKCISIGGSQ